VKRKVSDVIWETFDGLFKTLHRQGRRVEELEARVVELERRLQERAGFNPQPEAAERVVTQLPTEKAA
jgi:BMFP domain-containing protein YqiC